MEVFIALMAMIVGAPIAAIVLFCALCALGWRRGRQLDGPAVFYLLALCCAAIGVIAYGIGVAYAAFVHAGPDAAVCPVGRMQSPPVRESLVPLAHDCLYADGTTVHLVPGSVNPLAFATIIATGAFIVLGLHASRRRRSARASPAEDNAAARR